MRNLGLPRVVCRDVRGLMRASQLELAESNVDQNSRFILFSCK